MIEITGFYYDGKTATQFAVSSRFYETGLIRLVSTKTYYIDIIDYPKIIV
jgi:hypothetical protein